MKIGGNMKHRCISIVLIVLFMGFVFLPALVLAQGTKADYERAAGLRDKFQGLAINLPDRPSWIGKTSRFWYRKTVKEGFEFDVVDTATLRKKPAFDHAELAASLISATGEKFDAQNFPFQTIDFADDEKSILVDVGPSRWKVDLSTYTCTKIGPAERRRRFRFTGELPQAPSPGPKTSPDGKWEAFIRNFNVWLLSKDEKEEFPLSWEGSEGDAYASQSLVWSPDSKKLAAYRIRPGYHRKIHYVESSPADQLQPKYSAYEYEKPGDLLDRCQLALFQIDTKKQILIDDSLFPNPYFTPGEGPNEYSMPDAVWWKDSRAFTFEYNQRGHQVYRIIEVDAVTGKPRALVNEESKTFFCYYSNKYRYDVQDGKEIIWASERDGWNHLYLYDGASGTVKNQITKGAWRVRGVDKVDEAARQIWFRASGMNPSQDPYFIHYCRINFNGTGMTVFTEGNGNHSVIFSTDMKYYVDSWSRVDLPPVMGLHRTSDKKILMHVEKADIQDLVKAGWHAPEVFVAKGRDGKTDIWGIIIRPMNFNPERKYPVVEYIYAGPHGSFVPKTFSPYNSMQSVAELGFIVAQIDGMGTNNRSKAFHDVCWKNIGDAGFPDRILWHKAVAAKYPYYDISRVGIYGGSAGGQNSTGALLFHPEFYKVAVSFAGCHDNRMDKISWNEQWMGWPVGPEYSASSNVDNAYRLRGKLLLVVGELDTNVDPASTMQVVNALIKANKNFDLLVMPGLGHGAGRRENSEYGDRKRNDFFVRHLLGVEPPGWNKVEAQK